LRLCPYQKVIIWYS